MVDKGLLPDDKVVVDRYREAKSGDIVLASVDEVFIVRVLHSENGVTKLVVANSVDNYPEIEKFEVRGVVTGSFRRFK
jgi:SOS-response transcriptional repressor LexA